MQLTIRRISAITAIIIAILSCGSKYAVKEQASTFDKFPVEINLKETPVQKITDIKPDGLLLYRDSLLLIRNSMNTSPFHFSVFDPVHKTMLTGIMEAGRHPGQSMGFLSYGLVDNKVLWVNDIIKNKIILLSVDSALDKKEISAKEVDVPQFYYGTELTGKQHMIGTGDYDSGYKLADIDLSTNKIVKQSFPYTTDSLHLVSRVQKMAYESLLVLKPSNDKCANAARYADRLEVFDLKNRKSIIVKGPESFEPEMITMTGHDGKALSARGPETRYAFVKAKATNKYIYLLYSGNNHQGEHLYYGKSIYVYDWDGKPVKKINLSGYILDFAVKSDDSLIYIYNPGTKYLSKATLN